MTTKDVFLIGVSGWLLIGFIFSSLDEDEKKKSSTDRAMIGWKKMIGWPYFLVKVHLRKNILNRKNNNIK